MINLKSLPLAVTVLGLGAASTFAEIKINDNLSTTGFLDMSSSGVSPDSGDATLNASFDQFELDFIYKFGNISARADVNAMPSTDSSALPGGGGKPGGSNSAVFLEQGFVGYSNGAFGINAGRFLSSSGFEAAEPIGMFQFSYSKTLVYGYYQNGLNLSYTTPVFALYGAVVSDLWNPQEFELLNSPGYEGQVALTLSGVTAKAAYLYQVYDEDVSGGDESQSLLNVWAQYAGGPITVAGEFNYMMDWATKGVDDADGWGFLAMGNFKATDKIAATLRYSAIQWDLDGPDGDYDSEITFSPSYAVTPNWLLLAEGKYEFLPEQIDYAVESTFSF